MNRWAITTVAVAALVTAGCSGDDDAEPAVTSTTLVVEVTSESVAATDGSAAPGSTSPTGSTVAPGPTGDAGATTAATSAPTTASVPLSIPETGVPGLDSADEFCAAWSRFGGSWQVLLVGSTFLEDPQRVAEWEVAASTVIAESYADLVDSLPSELAEESDAVVDEYFGALERRSATARMALATAGGTDADRRRLQQAWTEALATRDPSTPDLVFEIPDGLGELVASAATALREQRVEFHLDPTLVIEASTPLTDSYLESTCPDRGTLAGGEVDPDQSG